MFYLIFMLQIMNCHNVLSNIYVTNYELSQCFTQFILKKNSFFLTKKIFMFLLNVIIYVEG